MAMGGGSHNAAMTPWLVLSGGSLVVMGCWWWRWRGEVAVLRAQVQQAAITMEAVQKHMDHVIRAGKEAERQLEHEKEKRAADRAGRIRAEQEVRRLQLALVSSQQQQPQPPQQQKQPPSAADSIDSQAATPQTDAAIAASEADKAISPSSSPSASLPITSNLSVFPLRPIGYMTSCFSQRNGTPRQPQLVPTARAAVRLAADIPGACLEGLTLFSHVWILFVFHKNTDLAKCLTNDRASGIKAKINVPRLNGGRLGVLATRSPHRPAPIGLSVAQVIGIKGKQLILGGVDIVDGSPVLDIKPYVPFCDNLPGATAPSWVAAEAEDEPLHMAGVTMSSDARQQLRSAWQHVRRTSLYSCADDFLKLVEQVLARDIRSFHQRSLTAASTPMAVGGSQQQGNGAQAGNSDGGGGGEEVSVGGSSIAASDVDVYDGVVYHVVLDRLDISYKVVDGAVRVLGAEVWSDQE